MPRGCSLGVPEVGLRSSTHRPPLQAFYGAVWCDRCDGHKQGVCRT